MAKKWMVHVGGGGGLGGWLVGWVGGWVVGWLGECFQESTT